MNTHVVGGRGLCVKSIWGQRLTQNKVQSYLNHWSCFTGNLKVELEKDKAVFILTRT